MNILRGHPFLVNNQYDEMRRMSVFTKHLGFRQGILKVGRKFCLMTQPALVENAESVSAPMFATSVNEAKVQEALAISYCLAAWHEMGSVAIDC